ncbi:MAG TPA: hypothetical protein VM364_00715 [Vicinamibacterales bacterium]|nr:hypothetical protein [Vicinamibacterales bacterium]
MPLPSTTVGLHLERQADTARAAFLEVAGPARSFQRSLEIARLPRVDWRGRRLYTLRCQGTSGKGPHDVNVPEGLLWSLIDLRMFRCPYHAHDVSDPGPEQPGALRGEG